MYMIDIALTTEFAITAGGATTGADGIIRWFTMGAVVGAVAVAAVASYEHAYALAGLTVKWAGLLAGPVHGKWADLCESDSEA
jgi:hypothetical protein